MLVGRPLAGEWRRVKVPIVGTAVSRVKGTSTTMRVMKFGAGQSIKRVEDIRFITGGGRYSTDTSEEATLRAVFLRSPHGHATFRVDDIKTASAFPGVRGVFVGDDFSALGDLPCLGSVKNSDKSLTPLKPFPVMSKDRVDHIGDIVAMVVADNATQARDAAEAIAITWGELPAVTDLEAAIRPGAPVVFEGAPNNIAYDTYIGDKEKTDAIFNSAAKTTQIKIVNPRVVANFMEPRSALGEFDAKSGRSTLHVSCQGVHMI